MKILLENISKDYGPTRAVSNLNLTIEDSSLHFILGPSGCGKTTTLRMLAGLEKPTEGKIYFGSTDVTKLSPSERNIGMVFQNYALWPHMTIEQNISYGLKIKKMSQRETQKQSDKYMDMMHLGDFKKRYPSQLSGGQQQRVALARALAIEPKVLLLDEPLSNLDAKLRLEMRHNIKKIHKETKITTIYVTHDQSESLSMGTSITVMKDGKHIQSGSPKEVYNKPINSFIAKFIGETNLINGFYRESNKTQHIINTDFGLFYTNKQNQNFDKNQPVTLSIRPELFKLSKTNEATKNSINTFDLKLQEKTYLGESEQWQLVRGTTQIPLTAKVLLDSNNNYPLNTTVTCSIKADSISLFKN